MKRTLLVTGGNRGIGLAIVRKLSTGGHAVLLGSRNLGAGERAVEHLRQDGLDVTPLQVDFSDSTSIDDAANEIEKAGRSVDVLVNNAGVLHEKPLLELTNNEIAESIAVHLNGPIRLVRSLVPNMAARGYGRIVNVSSGWGSFAEGMGVPGAQAPTRVLLVSRCL